RGTHRGGTGAASFPPWLAAGPASPPAGASGLSAAEQRARGGAVAGARLCGGPAVAASPGTGGGGSDEVSHPFLHLAPPRSGSAAVGEGNPLHAAAQEVHGVTPKWLHLSSKRKSDDSGVVALTLSIDGATAATYEAIRVRAHLDRV